MEINGASAIVTGGASGIGEAAAKRLSALGARCVILDLDEAKGKELASALGGEFAKADVSNAEEVQAAVDAAVALGPLRVLVNSAGVGSIGRTVDREGKPFDLDAFERVLRINLTGSFNCLRLAAAAMARTDPVDAEGQRGAIVNMASAAAFDGQTGQAAYSASKGGIVGNDAADRTRSARNRSAGQHDRAGSDRHADLRRRAKALKNSRHTSHRTWCSRSDSVTRKKSHRWSSNSSPTIT